MMKRLCLICCLLIGNFIQAQDLFVKQTNASATLQLGRTNMVLIPGGGMLSAANFLNGKSNKSIVIHRYTSCGEILWSKSLEHIESLNLIDMQVDSLGNTLILGTLTVNTNETIFLISVSSDGDVNFFKRYDVNSSLKHITYSIAISPQNEYYVYINYDAITGGALRHISLLKLDYLGLVKWYKIYNYDIGFYGFMIATSDSGVLLTMGNELIKIDFEGKVDWIKKYDGRDVTNLIETNDGYAFNYLEFGNKNPHIVCLNKNGTLKWDFKDFNLIEGWKGISRRNGNLLFMGNVKQSASELGILELNSINGSLIRSKSIDILNTRIDDIEEDKNGNVFFSGIRNNQIVLAKLNDTLSTLSCHSKSLAINYAFDTLAQTTINTVGSTLSQVSVLDELYTESTISATTTVVCSYYENPNAPELGNDTTLCPGVVLTVGVPNSSFATYKWSTGESSKTIDVKSSGQYILSVKSACDTLRDTINISYFTVLNIELGSDTILCTKDSLELGKSLVLPNYLWSTGETSHTIVVDTAGLYWLESKDQCVTVRDSIKIDYYTTLVGLDLGADTIVCPGENFVINSGNYTEYLWSTGETSSSIILSDSGLIWVEVRNVCDTLRDTIYISYFPSLMPKFDFSTTQVMTNDSIQFRNLTANSLNAKWNMGNGEEFYADTLNYSYEVSGNYKVTLTVESSDGCRFSVSDFVTILPSNYHIPNVFSPNNDGVNDEFKPVGEDIENFDLSICNRWGGDVFTSTNISWNGFTQNGEKAESGNYFYKIKLYFNNGYEVEKSGSLSLLR